MYCMCSLEQPLTKKVYWGRIMGLKSGTKKFFKRSWNVASWLNLEQIKEEHRVIASLAKKVMCLEKPNSDGTNKDFNELVSEHNYTESDLRLMIRKSKQLSYLYAVVSLLIIGYLLIVMAQGNIFSAMCCIPLAGVCLAYAFKESYFAFCVRSKSFGVSVWSWCSQLFSCEDM